MIEILLIGAGIALGAVAGFALSRLKSRSDYQIDMDAAFSPVSVEEDDDGLVTLMDEEGHKHTFTVLDTLEIEEKEYVLLSSTEEDRKNEVLVMRYNGQSLVTIESEEEFQRIIAIIEDEV